MADLPNLCFFFFFFCVPALWFCLSSLARLGALLPASFGWMLSYLIVFDSSVFFTYIISVWRQTSNRLVGSGVGV